MLFIDRSVDYLPRTIFPFGPRYTLAQTIVLRIGARSAPLLIPSTFWHVARVTLRSCFDLSIVADMKTPVIWTGVFAFLVTPYARTLLLIQADRCVTALRAGCSRGVLFRGNGHERAP